MIMFTGQGWIAAVVICGALLSVKAAAETRGGPEAFFEPKTQLLLIALCVLPCFAIGRLLNRGLPPKVWDAPRLDWDDQTRTVNKTPALGHTLAFIRVEHAGWLILFVLALFWLDHAGFFG
ncbi:MAG: hypothetical protein RL701_5314 [Pseudomonadota bacterium]